MPDTPGRRPLDLVCIAHLWWEWVWQRPQQLMSRLARHYRVLYVEEPHIEIGPEHEGFEVEAQPSGVEVARLVLRSDHDTFWRRLEESQIATAGHPFAVSRDIVEASLMYESIAQPRLEREVADLVAARRRGPLVVWLYTPLVLRFAELLRPDLLVYDVMDELRAFRFAPPRLRELEEELLDRADLVFTGGPSMHEVRRDRRPDALLFPSGVDVGHFARALDPDLPVPPAVAGLPHPVIGFFGVIDERSDLNLLASAAAARPDWSWVVIGPPLKVQRDGLPRAPNLHYLGKQPYEDLPAYLKAFDVAMMPFALNEATRYISPTKTLEYMAAHRPIVSTPVPDVVSLYGSVVRIAEGPERFVAEIEAALRETDDERERRVAREDRILAGASWDAIADSMRQLIERRLESKPARAPTSGGGPGPS